MHAARGLLIAPMLVFATACGDSTPGSSCGDRGTEVVTGSLPYCVYDASAVRAGGGRITCPVEVPNAVAVGEAQVCTAPGAPTDAAALPPEVCARVTDPCGAELADPDAATPLDAGSGDTGSAPDGGAPPDGSTATCPAAADRPTVEVSGVIDHDETWSCANDYELIDPLFVGNGATLTILPGTVVRSSRTGGLFITPDGKIDAAGTASEPIVMTSNLPVGMRRAGDWVGLYLAGRAPLGDTATTIALGDDPRLTSGGTDGAHDCGRIRYVRFEFAGQRTGAAVRLGGCGSRTVVDGLQVHLASGDALELLGGTVDIRHLLVTDQRDRAIYWNRGWRGRGQFIAVRTLASALDRGVLHGRTLEGLVSRATFANVTIASIGSGRTRAAFVLDGGGGATLTHGLFWGGYESVLDLKDTESVEGTMADPPTVDVRRSLFFGLGDDPTAYFGLEASPPLWDDAGFDEGAWASDPSRMNRFGIDPGLLGPERLLDPQLAPAAGSPASGSGPLPGDTFFDSSATYAGAFAPGGPDWTTPWAAYPPQ